MIEIIKMYLPYVLKTIVIIIVASLALYSLKSLFSRHKKQDRQAVLVAKNASYFLVISISFIMLLSAWGIDVAVFLTGFGITGFAVGFALKDILSNYLSGLMVLIYKPLKINDLVSVGSHKGYVRSIDLRYTVLENDNENILIPNSKIFTETIIKIKTK